MKRYLLHSLLVAISAASAAAQSSTLPTQIAAADARRDLTVLEQALNEAHPALFRYTSKRTIDSSFAARRASLVGPIPITDFYAMVSRAVAEVHDGHLRFEESDAVNAVMAAAPLFPLRFLVEGSRLIVLYNDSRTDSLVRPGDEVRAINGRSAQQILETILPALSHDGFIDTGRKARLGRAFGAYYWLFVDRAPEFELTVRGLDGVDRSVRLAGIRGSERGTNANPVNGLVIANLPRIDGPRDNISLQFHDSARIAKVRIRMFLGDGFEAGLDSVFRVVRDSGSQSMIIDLRGNGGGYDEKGMYLVSKLVSRPSCTSIASSCARRVRRSQRRAIGSSTSSRRHCAPIPTEATCSRRV